VSPRPATPAQALRLISKPRRNSRNQLDRVRDHDQSSSSMDRELGFPALLTSEEVARVMRVNERTLRRLRTDNPTGFPAPLQLGRALRWRASEIKTWMEGRA